MTGLFICVPPQSHAHSGYQEELRQVDGQMVDLALTGRRDESQAARSSLKDRIAALPGLERGSNDALATLQLVHNAHGSSSAENPPHSPSHHLT